MDYNYTIYDKASNDEIYKDRTTLRGKQATIADATRRIQAIGTKNCYAIITSFDWRRGVKAVGRIG